MKTEHSMSGFEGGILRFFDVDHFMVFLIIILLLFYVLGFCLFVFWS